MKKFVVRPEIFQKHPDLAIGLVCVSGAVNGVAPSEVTARLRQEEARIRQTFPAIEHVPVHPRIESWRNAYQGFGAKPRDYRSSIEAMYRRVVNGKEIPSISALVDVYNIISLAHMLPAGGEDLDQVKGDIVLGVATDHEAPSQMLGDDAPHAPFAGEIFYKDDEGAICRCWNWREADRTKLTEKTTHAVLVLEALPPVGREELERATQELSELVKHYCGGTVATFFIDREQTEAKLLS